MKKLSILLLILALVIPMITCVSCNETVPSLEGTNWLLTEMDEKAVSDDSYISIYFSEDIIDGYLRYNRYTGNYTAGTSGTLQTGDIAETRINTAFSKEENAYLSALENITSYTISGDILELHINENSPPLVFERIQPFTMDPADLIGTGWKLVSINDDSLPEDLEITLMFESGSTAFGQVGAFNHWLYYRARNDRLTCNQKTSREGSQSAEREQYAARYMDSIGNSPHSYILNADSLELQTEQGDTLIYTHDEALSKRAAIQTESSNIAQTIMSPQYPAFSLDDLIELSETIVLGTVLEVRIPQKGIVLDKTIIFHDVVIDIEQDLTENCPGQQLIIRQLGGTIDNETFFVDVQPFFVTGEKAILFLRLNDPEITSTSEDKQSNDIYGVVGGSQGYFTFLDDTTVSGIDNEYSVTEIEEYIKEFLEKE